MVLLKGISLRYAISEIHEIVENLGGKENKEQKSEHDHYSEPRKSDKPYSAVAYSLFSNYVTGPLFRTEVQQETNCSGERCTENEGVAVA
jgi:hypothetical protein